MARKILCVAEKPSIAKAVAQHLAGAAVRAVNIPGNVYTKNYSFDFTFSPPWGRCQVTMTSVAGHIYQSDFHKSLRSWGSCPPSQLFEAPIFEFVPEDKTAIAENIERQARGAHALYIWTDCDREGEAIGAEIRKLARITNANVQVKRAVFSNTERTHILQAVQRPVDLDERQVNAVVARSELDLRLGAAFTRFTSLTLQTLGPPLVRVSPDAPNVTLSYGSCQFPTLGFVVDRYFKVKDFVPEKFWGINVMHHRDETNTNFLWERNRLYDRAATIVILERCLAARFAKVVKVQKKPASKWRPLPLTTVELQKYGSMYLRLSSKTVMDVAEKLYQNGWISYPRTETDQFDKEINLKRLVEKQNQSPAWGSYANDLLSNKFTQPRSGRNNDKAHPPIHPVNYVAPSSLKDDEKRVYEFVVRRFLACCSPDAKGESSTVGILYGDEVFSAHGLTVLERNYLDVYIYEKWTSTQVLPKFEMHESFEPTEANITDGKTTAPSYLTEPELISLMDANGIGTDATMAEHIKKIQDREYVRVQGGSRSTMLDERPLESRNGVGRGGRGNTSRGRGRGRGGAGAGSDRPSSIGTVQTFIPTTLGVALIKGYDDIGLETSLSKPFLRKEMEEKMREICAGTKSKNDFVQETLAQYRGVYITASQQKSKLIRAAERYVFQRDV